MANEELHCHYAYVSGSRDATAGALVHRYRYEADFRAAKVESWLMYFKMHDDDTTTSHATGLWNNYVSGLWVSDSGRMYAAIATGWIGIYSSVRKFDELHAYKAGSVLTGIWGLDDEHVWAYGGSPDRRGYVYFFNGKAWTELPQPPAWILKMHGCAPDCVYGVGRKSAYRWDGKTWTETALRAAQPLSCIWVESPDELYATDIGGVLYEGSANGWIARAEWDGELQGVAKFKDKLWIGGGWDGLLRLNGETQKIEAFKPKITTYFFEAREQLLIPMPQKIVYSDDGERFRSFGLDGPKELSDMKPFTL